tara:strand:- start:163 stop:993 length:831 start_codon:yes stop_codon:yes gene_type:complete
MRSVKSNPRKSRNLNKKNFISQTNLLSIFQSKNFLIELWQLLFFSSTSIFLIFIFLNQAWRPIGFDQTEIKGISGITKNDIQKVTSIFYPRNLLQLNPKELEFYLIKKLPIKAVSVSRKFFPPQLHLSIKERDPIAFASKLLSNKIENGMIDIKGDWIPLNFVDQSTKNQVKLFVENWSPTKKNDIILILRNRFLLQSTLKKIKINHLEEISITTDHFNTVLLGSETDRLIEQINKLNQLQKSLPNLLINTNVKIVDLKDPLKPELKIEKLQSITK